MYGTKYGHDPRQLRPERCSASRLSAASSLGPADGTYFQLPEPLRSAPPGTLGLLARPQFRAPKLRRQKPIVAEKAVSASATCSRTTIDLASSSRSLLLSPASACTSLCMHSPTSLGRLSPPEAWCPSQVRAIAGELRRTPVPPSVEPITVGRAGSCRHIESQGQAARALRCSRALSRAGCLLAFAASLRSRRSSGGSGTAFLLCAPDAPCG